MVGQEPVLSKKSPAFQYSSHVSLQAPSGHMWLVVLKLYYIQFFSYMILNIISSSLFYTAIEYCCTEFFFFFFGINGKSKIVYI